MFDDANSPAFAPAEDLPGWIEATFLDPASPVHNPDHAHLAHVVIGFLRTIVGNSKKGRCVIGQCETGAPQDTMGKWSRVRADMQVKEWFGDVADFVITLDANYCRECGAAEFMALVEHELHHAEWRGGPSLVLSGEGGPESDEELVDYPKPVMSLRQRLSVRVRRSFRRFIRSLAFVLSHSSLRTSIEVHPIQHECDEHRYDRDNRAFSPAHSFRFRGIARHQVAQDVSKELKQTVHVLPRCLNLCRQERKLVGISSHEPPDDDIVGFFDVDRLAFAIAIGGSAGRPVFVIRAQETLAGVARRLGAAGVRAMVVAANQKPEIARMQSAHACGACQLRPA
ncbi:putative metallopeptidase [Ensifer sp. NPDC090286]|uniref:putative metallopeptidase n=1 Tax=Ensifer sp. NPDC090286 TaxID=3363991 RepID=UPI00383A72BA